MPSPPAPNLPRRVAPDLRPATRWTLLLAIATGTLLVALGDRYGFHRDELYFLEASRHLAWGYPDQPPGAPVAARLSAELFGDGPRGVHAVSAIVVVLVVLAAGGIARRLGAGAIGQVLACVLVAGCAFVLSVGHIASTSTFDLLGWTLATLVVLDLGRDPRRWRTWILLGLVVGATFLFKTLVVLLLAGILLGSIVATRARIGRAVLARAAVAAGIAALGALPYALWQSSHGWPQLELASDISGGDDAAPWRILLDFLLLAGPPLAPVWIAGGWWLLRRGAPVAERALGIASITVLAATMASGGKGYYLAGLLPLLFAAGAVVLERGWHRAVLGRTVVPVLVVSVAVSAVVSLPVVPERRLAATPVTDLNPDIAETVGWHAFTDQLEAAAARHDAPIVFAGNYGLAGALLHLGEGSTAVASGHNGFHAWGPPPEDAVPVIVTGFGREDRRVDEHFRGCGRVDELDNGVDVDSEDQGSYVWRCDAPIGSWRTAWPGLRRLAA